MPAIRNKTFIPIVLILVIALVVGIGLVNRQQLFKPRAAPTTTLDLLLQAQPPTVNVGDTFTINLNINTNTNQVIGAETYILFDKTKLQATDVTLGSFLTGANVLTKTLDNTNGKISYIVFLPTGSVPKTGAGTLATITFQAIAAGSANVSVDPASIVGAVGENGQNALQTADTASITIQGAASPTPTPSLTPVPSTSPTSAPTVTNTNTPTPTRTPTPTASPVPTLTHTPTPTRTPTPTPSPVPTATNTPTPTGIGGPQLTNTATPTPTPNQGCGNSCIPFVQEGNGGGGAPAPVAAATGTPQTFAPGDINKNGRVDIFDASILARKWNKTTDITDADLNHDGKVDIFDASILSKNWTK